MVAGKPDGIDEWTVTDCTHEMVVVGVDIFQRPQIDRVELGSRGSGGKDRIPGKRHIRLYFQFSGQPLSRSVGLFGPSRPRRLHANDARREVA